MTCLRAKKNPAMNLGMRDEVGEDLDVTREPAEVTLFVAHGRVGSKVGARPSSLESGRAEDACGAHSFAAKDPETWFESEPSARAVTFERIFSVQAIHHLETVGRYVRQR